MLTKDSFRVIVLIVAHFDLELHHIDVKTTFLNEDLVEDVCMSQPIGFKEVGKEHMICELCCIWDLRHCRASTASMSLQPAKNK